MALDASLFTLTFQRRAAEATVLDLIPFNSAASNMSTSTQTEPLYTFVRARSNAYNVQLQDHLTSMPLASIEAPSSADKIRQIKLYNPDDAIIMEKKAMTFRQEWHWTWQGQEYFARRDGRSYIVEAQRKPDPEIDIARYTARTKTRPAFLQMLDYNIQRLEVEDRRGLEMLILMAICTLLDAEYDEKYKDGPSGNVYFSGYNSSLSTSTQYNLASPSASAQNHFADVKTEPNELHIDVYTPKEVIAQRAITLLRQDEGGEGLHLIILKALNSQVTPKAVQIAADIKAKWYRLEPVAKGRTLDPLPGSQTEIAEELYQYVRDPSLQQSPGSSSSSTLSTQQNQSNGHAAGTAQRPRIKLDPPSSNKDDLPAARSRSSTSSPFKSPKPTFLPPPNQLDIYLSKEKLDEFEVRANASINSTLKHSPSQRGNVIPRIPPKKQQFEEQANETTGRKILGKLGIRKGQVNSQVS